MSFAGKGSKRGKQGLCASVMREMMLWKFKQSSLNMELTPIFARGKSRGKLQTNELCFFFRGKLNKLNFHRDVAGCFVLIVNVQVALNLMEDMKEDMFSSFAYVVS